MSGALVGIGAYAANYAISVLLRPQRRIGSLLIPNATVQEQHTDTLAVTRHPVQIGAVIADHAYMQPFQLTIEAAWSNSSIEAAVNAFQSNNVLGAISDGVFGESYVQRIYAQVRKLQTNREPIEIVTGKRKYKNMLLTSISTTTTKDTEYALILTLGFEEVILVSVETTTLSPRSSQANPAATASPVSTGISQPVENPDASLLRRLGNLF